MCLTIAVLAGFLIRGYFGSKTRQAEIKARLKAEIQKGISENSFQRKVTSFLEDNYKEAEFDAKKCNFWVNRLGATEYDGVQLGMWDVDERCEEWYYTYFLKNFAVVPYGIKTPEQVSLFLNTVFTSENNIERVVLYLDPVSMYENYKKSFLTDSGDILTFPQEYRECILGFAADHPEVSFSLNLPVVSANEWSRKTGEETDSILSIWNDYVYYGSWYNNVKIHAMGLEDWLIANDDSFEGGRMIPKISKKVFALENTDQYTVDDESIGAGIETLKSVIDKERAHGYTQSGLYDYNILFVGDSIFDQNEEDTLSIPGFVKGFTSADCYNLSRCGTSACYVENDCSFTEVSEWVKNGKNEFPEDTRSRRELERLQNSSNQGKKTFIVIEYGFNDYCRGFSKDEFKTALQKGIDNLTDAFPGAGLLVVSPLFSEYGNYGTETFSEESLSLKDYVETAAEVVSEYSNAEFLDMFTDSFINAETCSYMLRDGVHPTYDANILIAESITKKLSQIKR